MKQLRKNLLETASKLLLIALMGVFALCQVGVASAATTPSLGAAASFGILSSTYTNTVPGTTITGDLGYTTPPAVTPTVTGATHVADAIYSQAGTDQGSALSTGLAPQACTFTFAPGAIDLASDVTHGPVGVYTPGVYCITGAASIGGGGTITLDGAGTYIFRMTGALNTSANSIVTLANGASACDVFWTPGGATTLGANSTFIGTDINDQGITVGSTVSWTGRALAFGGTVSTDVDNITVPTCTSGGGGSTPGLPSTGELSNSNSAKPWIALASMAVIGSIGAYFFIRMRKAS